MQTADTGQAGGSQATDRLGHLFAEPDLSAAAYDTWVALDIRTS